MEKVFDCKVLGFSGQEKSARNSKPTCVKILEKLTQLETLYLSKNKLTDVMGLEKLTRLTFLSLSSNPLTELPKGLENLTQLTDLRLRNNQLTDVKGLEKLTQLEKLHLNDNPDLTRAQIDQLQKALPDCAIYLEDSFMVILVILIASIVIYYSSQNSPHNFNKR